MSEVIQEPIRRNIVHHAMRVQADSRACIKHQRPCVIWLTGLSGAGKSTIASVLDELLYQAGHHTYVLDGDNLRQGLNSDLGFSDAARRENVRRLAEVARLMAEAGLVTIVAAISPLRLERERARTVIEATAPFVEVFVDVPLEVAERRDPKGLYRRARAGEIPNFTGIQSAYDEPDCPDLRLDTTYVSPDEAAEQIRRHIESLISVAR